MQFYAVAAKCHVNKFMVLQLHPIHNLTLIRRLAGIKLAEVGRFAPQRSESNYETGQLFLHKIFGYRGVILFPWQAKVYDRDLSPKQGKATGTSSGERKLGDKLNKPSLSGTLNSSEWSEGAVHTHAYYQVLMDERDRPFLRTQYESVTFLGRQDGSRSLYAIAGLDYVAHDDVLPYTSADKQAIKHELFDKFLEFDAERDPCFCSRDTLRTWMDKNYPWLELSDVHKETTENIRVTVTPFYMGCREEQNNNNVHWWRYCIRLENLSGDTVTLRERDWRIFSLSGTLETVRGRGVVGTEPVLSKLAPAFQYSSHVSLQAPSGHMWGTFKMEREDGSFFECRIPPFTLESKRDDSSSPLTTATP